MIRVLSLILINILLFPIFGSGNSFSYQETNQWSPVQNIPGFHPETWPPILLADQNKTVHAFSSQWLGNNQGFDRRVIVYNQWTREGGWTEPIDILLSPNKNDARLTDAFLDQSGRMHVVFWGGDNTGANIYYSSAPAVDAGKTAAWSSPTLVTENAMDPENAALIVQDPDHIGILFSGIRKEPGLYVTYSDDGGETWSAPLLVANSGDLSVNELQIHQNQSGELHAIWNQITSGGQGRGIYYANSKIGEKTWSDPIVLADADSGYGTQTPAIIEYDGEIFVFSSGIVMRRSKDGGKSWSEPVPIFRRHTGVNGSLSPVIDSNGDLHLFFGQRITGNPDIHGMWHSIWKGGYWSEPEPIVSGPTVQDLSGDKSFDPFEARAVVSQGNVILVTWRTDPGLKGNGVWYSSEILDAPELPLVPLKAVQLENNPQLPALQSTSLPIAQNGGSEQSDSSNSINLNDDIQSTNKPSRLILIGIVPAILLIAIVVVLRKTTNLV